MVFRPSRVRRILMQFYVWKNINGLFTFALSTPEDRLHDIIVFFTSEVLDVNYWFTDGNNILDLSRNQVFFVTQLLYKILLDFFKWMFFISKNWHKCNKYKFGVIVHDSRSIALLLYVFCMKPILRSAQNLLVNDEDPLSC